jgi:hypothetical protein
MSISSFEYVADGQASTWASCCVAELVNIKCNLSNIGTIRLILTSSGEITGSFPVLRTLGRLSSSSSTVYSTLLGDSVTAAAEVDEWLAADVSIVTNALPRVLKSRTYLAGHSLTIADIFVFALVRNGMFLFYY